MISRRGACWFRSDLSDGAEDPGVRIWDIVINCRSDASCSRGQEFFCIAGCVSGSVNDGGVADDATFAQCASNCAVAGTIISSATNDAIACVRYGERVDGSVGADCFVECFDE